MVYNIKASNGAPLVSIPDSTQDTTATSITLVGRNSVGFGLAINQNFVDLLQNFSNTSPPPSPLSGQLWFDSVKQELKVYDGKKWIIVNQPFDGASGVLSTQVGIKNTDVSVVISQYQIISVISADRIERSDCPNNVIINDISYAFAARFPNGLFPGINLATDPSNVVKYIVNGTSSYANVLLNSRTIYIKGDVVGQVKFDGSSDVNVSVKAGNVYVNNTNVTVAGTYTKVLVNDGGRVIAGNNIVASDVVSALGYVPYNGANVSVEAVGNTMVGRDQNASFAANVIVVNDIAVSNVVASNSIAAIDFIGTASNARVLTTPRTIHINGDMYGDVEFDGSTDIVLTSNLVASGVTAGTYNLVNVDSKGRVTNGSYDAQIPLGSIMVFPDTVVPSGWVRCSGGTIIDPQTGTVYNIPNLVTQSTTLSSGTGMNLTYLMRYTVSVPNLTANTPSSGPVVIINGTVVSGGDVPVISTSLSGGPPVQTATIGFGNISIATTAITALNPDLQFTTTGYMDTEYFDALALIMSIGDTNGIMFSEKDVWKNIGSLTIQDIIGNLSERSRDNLPAAVGKYMIPLRLIQQQATNLAIPSNFAFDPMLQDQLISSITSNFAHQLAIANIPATDINLMGCHYLASADAWIKVLKSSPDANVAETLINAGYFITATSKLNEYTRNQLLYKFADIMQIAQKEVIYRKESGRGVISSGQYPNTGNANVIVTTALVDGYRIGNSNYTELQGGYFPDYANVVVDTNTVAPSTEFGSAGTILVSLVDAGATALAAVLQTSNANDQAALCQLIINRLGGTLSGIERFNGNNAFDAATYPNSFSAISAAIYGPNNDAAASALFGNLRINKDELYDALSVVDPVQMQQAVESLFMGTLTAGQLSRLAVLRSQVYNNGPELSQARATIKTAVNYIAAGVAPPPDLGPSILMYPFGDLFTGYIKTSALTGFYVQNSSDVAGSSPAPSPDALLNRLKNNLLSNVPVTVTPTPNTPPVPPTPPTEVTVDFTTPGVHVITMPDFTGSVSFDIAGGGGGGGGWDAPYAGYNGYSGNRLSGLVATIAKGDIITIHVGGGGKRGKAGGNIPGGEGGVSSAGFDGGDGGKPSVNSGWSGAGGGGGAATAIYINGNLFAVAAGGGGGGGGGLYSAGKAQQASDVFANGTTGAVGSNQTRDGGGGGGGGGGNRGGTGGKAGQGDVGAYSGNDGTNLIGAGLVASKATNGGTAGRNTSTDGGDGFAIVKYTKI